MNPIPKTLLESLRPVTLICGHYGVGKTNFTCNLAKDLADAGRRVTVIDLDIVNPYFRASEQRTFLESAGVSLVAPVFAEAGSSLDVPSLRGAVGPALQAATQDSPVIVDVGGDDAGSIALGRFAHLINSQSYAMFGVLNAYRNLVQTPQAAVENLKEIEAACGLGFSALVDNTHLQDQTDLHTIETGYGYSEEASKLTGLPLVAVTVPRNLAEQVSTQGSEQIAPSKLIYPVSSYVHTPWE